MMGVVAAWSTLHPQPNRPNLRQTIHRGCCRLKNATCHEKPPFQPCLMFAAVRQVWCRFITSNNDHYIRLADSAKFDRLHKDIGFSLETDSEYHFIRIHTYHLLHNHDQMLLDLLTSVFPSWSTTLTPVARLLSFFMVVVVEPDVYTNQKCIRWDLC